MRRPIIAGNWKMNGSRASVAELLEGLKSKADGITHADLIVCPPAIFLPQVADSLEHSHITWGGQNCCEEDQGAFTGEISASMLADFACQYVILGHSERRHVYHETNAMIAKKYVLAQSYGLTPILCVGETQTEREAGETLAVIAKQLDAILSLPQGVETLAKAVVAYEPVWAIGTGLSASPDQAQQVHAAIRNQVADKNQEVADGLRILYGGSLKPDNAADLFARADIDGGLIGGASLKADDFIQIAQQAG